MGKKKSSGSKLGSVFAPYRGRWVAYLDEQIIGQGGTPKQALRAAKNSRYKEKPQITYVPMSEPFAHPTILDDIRKILDFSPSVYLVGGAIRDALLSIPVHDLDFVLPENAFPVAKEVANSLNGAFYPLDKERETARVLVDYRGSRKVLDFAVFRGETLEDDLKLRDFTINAMAVSLQNPKALLDPLSGVVDLRSGILRSCSPSAFGDDPLRILRAVRLAAQFDFHIAPQTRKQIPDVVEQLSGVSPERIRDEIFRILDGPKQSSALKALDLLGAFSILFPDHHQLSAFTQRTLQHLESLINGLSKEHDSEDAASWALELAVLRLGRYRNQVTNYFYGDYVPGRSRRSLLFFAGLYVAQFQDETLVSFLTERSHDFHLGNVEVHHLQATCQALDSFLGLMEFDSLPDRRHVYRYFRTVEEAGIDAVFLALAGFLARRSSSPKKEIWTSYLDVAKILFESWWENYEEWVSPALYLDGTDLIETFKLLPGPLIGQLLESLREAQAAGEVNTHSEAFTFIQNQISTKR